MMAQDRFEIAERIEDALMHQASVEALLLDEVLRHDATLPPESVGRFSTLLDALARYRSDTARLAETMREGDAA